MSASPPAAADTDATRVSLPADVSGGGVRTYVLPKPLAVPPSDDPTELDVVITSEDGLSLVRVKPGLRFTPDGVVDDSSCYESVTAPVLASALEGRNGTVIFHGESGSGKTHAFKANTRQCIVDLFNKPDTFALVAEVIELYQGSVLDLGMQLQPAAPNDTTSRGDPAAAPPKFTQIECASAAELLNLVAAALDKRKAGLTLSNDNSSRSHLVVRITAVTRAAAATPAEGSAATAAAAAEHQRRGTITFADLAGAERPFGSGEYTADAELRRRLRQRAPKRMPKRELDKQVSRTIREGIAINKSLTALGAYVRATTPAERRRLQRESPLVALLHQSLEASSLASLVLTIQQDRRGSTARTLEFGLDAKKCVAVDRRKPFDAAHLARELKRLLNVPSESMIFDKVQGMLSCTVTPPDAARSISTEQQTPIVALLAQLDETAGRARVAEDEHAAFVELLAAKQSLFERQNAALTSQNALLAKQVRTLSATTAEATNRAHDAEMHVEHLRASQAPATSDLAALRVKHEEACLAARLAACVECRRLAEALQSAESAKRSLKRENAKLLQHKADFAARAALVHDELRAQIAALQTNLRECEATSVDAQRELRAQVSDLEVKTKQAALELNTSKLNLARSEAEADLYTRRHAEYGFEIDRLESEVADLQFQLSLAASDRDAAKQRLKNSSKALDDERHVQLQRKKSHDAEVAGLKRELDKANDTIKQLKGKG